MAVERRWVRWFMSIYFEVLQNHVFLPLLTSPSSRRDDFRSPSPVQNHQTTPGTSSSAGFRHGGRASFEEGPWDGSHASEEIHRAKPRGRGLGARKAGREEGKTHTQTFAQQPLAMRFQR